MSQNMAMAVSYQEFVDGVTETLNRHPAIEPTVEPTGTYGAGICTVSLGGQVCQP